MKLQTDSSTLARAEMMSILSERSDKTDYFAVSKVVPFIDELIANGEMEISTACKVYGVAKYIASIGSHSQLIIASLWLPLIENGYIGSTLPLNIDSEITEYLLGMQKLRIVQRKWHETSVYTAATYKKQLTKNYEKRSTKKRAERRAQVWQDISVQRTILAMSESAQKPECLIYALCERQYMLDYHENYYSLPTSVLLLVAQETLDIYATIAEILGVWQIKWRLEDTAFKLTSPQEYNEIKTWFDETREEREAILSAFKTELEEVLTIVEGKVSGIRNQAPPTEEYILDRIAGKQLTAREEPTDAVTVTGVNAEIMFRAKHFYSLHQKMIQAQSVFTDINDVLGIRIIIPGELDLVKTQLNANSFDEQKWYQTLWEKQCYWVLTMLLDLYELPHGLYGDKTHRDWIANPKPNGYQSLHTSVLFNFLGKPRLIEIQIRTNAMHNSAEYGIASHASYKGHSAKLARGMTDFRIAYEEYKALNSRT